MDSKQILKISLEKNWRGYEMFLILVAVLEGMMMLYGLHRFDFREMRRVLYFSAYLALFVGSLAAMILNRLCMTKLTYAPLAIGNAYLYTTLLILWSAMISALDIHGGGYAVTYMTVLAAVGSTVALPSALYAGISLLSTGMMIAVAQWLEGEILALPFYINHFIFLVVIIAVQMRNYRSLREQYLLEQRLMDLANRDALTGVANRRMLDERLKQLQQEGTGFTFILLDVDDFKTINDRYGHTEGDMSLIRITAELTKQFGAEVYRYGGDEFAVITFEEPERAARKMEELNVRLRRTAEKYTLRTCAGLYWVVQESSVNKIFEYADEALYEAKNRGKGRAVIYHGPSEEA